VSAPRLTVAGLGGDSGKTLVSLGILLLAQQRGLEVRAFKKGPDYIDAAWLRWAAGHPARNLDTYMMGFETPAASFAAHAATAGLNVIEGNRGLFDGSDPEGTHSTAELAKVIRSPIILVLTATKVTRTAAAFVVGCQYLDPKIKISGVVLNKVATSRQESVLREAIENASGVPVVGVLPRAKGETLLPGRHLGLVTPEEHPRIDEVHQNLLTLVEGNLDLDHLLDIALSAPGLPPQPPLPVPSPADGPLRVAYLADSAFTFYYPENLEALAAGGAELIPVSALSASQLPDAIDALYIGGGFPETHGATLAANKPFHASLRDRAAAGLPIYAECGGLMLLSRAIHWAGERHEMAGVLPFEVEVRKRPQGHGYTELTVNAPNPFFAPGAILRGHEFHYSRVIPSGELPPTACKVTRGTGCYQKRDAATINNVWASYTHLHALATPEWADGFLAAARCHRLTPTPDAAAQ
jgi:cobyrinic acid a,c-diamide synthase